MKLDAPEVTIFTNMQHTHASAAQGGPSTAPETVAATAKTTPADSDQLPLVDSAASNVLKKLTWVNVKATLKTYFDTLYQAVATYVTPTTLSNNSLPASVTNLATSGTNTMSALGAGIATFSAAGVISSTATVGAGNVPLTTDSAYTATATGLTTSPTGTVTYAKIGNVVTLDIPEFAGTSNSTSFYIGTAPASIRPSDIRFFLVRTRNNGGSVVIARALMNTAGNLFFYSTASGDAFLDSGTKTAEPTTVSYII